MVINGDYWEIYGDEWCFSVKMRILSGDIMGIGMKNGYLKSRNIYQEISGNLWWEFMEIFWDDHADFFKWVYFTQE